MAVAMAAMSSCCVSIATCKPKTFSLSTTSGAGGSACGSPLLLHLCAFKSLAFSSNLSLTKMEPLTALGKSAPLSGGKPEIKTRMKEESKGEGGSGRRIWRRRKLTRKNDKLRYKMDRIPFLEEQVRRIRETGKIMSMDIAKLLLSEENRFDFVNEVAAEATAYVENNRDEYGAKKPILHVLSNRMNEAGFYRPEAYIEPDPFKPGPTYLRDEL